MNNDTKILVEFPEFFFLKNTWSALLLDMKNHSGLFNNVKIFGIYGCFPNMIWNGGRVCISEKNPSEQIIKNTFELYKKYDVDLILTLTNLNITKDDLLDPYCNMILKYADEYNAQCNIVDIDLENYIRDNYPNVLINKSIIKNYVEDISTNSYHNYMVNSKYNNDIDYLRTLDNLDKVVLMANEKCYLDCPRIDHYKYISNKQIAKQPDLWDCDCNIKTNEITYDKVYQYLDLGINKFKFNNRYLGMIEQTIYDCIKFISKDIYFQQLYNGYIKMAKREIEQLDAISIIGK